MRRCITLLLLSACTSGTPLQPTSSPPLDVPGGTAVLTLDRLPAAVSLPESSIPASAPRDGRFVLDGWTPATESVPGALRGHWTVRLPFPEADQDRFLAADLALVVDGRAVRHQPMGRATEAVWRVHAGQLYLNWPHPEPPPAAVLTHARLAALLARLEPSRAGLSPADFVHHTLTVDGDTREGLLLPALATLSWRLTLPEGARLDAATGVVQTGLGLSTGAVLRLDVVDEAGEHRVASRELEGGVAGFRDWSVDLGAYGGREVELRLSLEPGGSPDWDLAFVAHPAIVGARAGAPPRRVVWIGLDTTRPDHLGLHGYGRDTSPRLDAWAASATVFDDAVAPAPRTRPSFRSALTGRRPLDAVGAPTVLEVLDREGFATAGIAANVHLNARFGFTRGADRWLLDTEARADTQVDRAISWLDSVADRDAALFLHIMDPHLVYDAPEPYHDRFVVDPDPDLPRRFTRSTVLGWMRAGLDERRKAHIEALYDGEIAFTDAQLGRLFDHLDTLPGRSLVVVHSDHGEELWEHGGFEHNHTLKPEVVDALTLVRTPGQREGRRVAAPVTLADLVPTVLDLLGVAGPPSDGASLRPLLEGGELAARPLDLGHLMYDTERWGVRLDGHTYVLHTGSGEEWLFDRAADPGEHVDLVRQGADPARFRAALAQAHGIDVGPGWRAEVRLQGSELTWELPAPALSAGVLDPESLRARRANLVWGERAPIAPSDVAAVALSDDGRTLTITPGPHAMGTLWVRFAAPTPPGGVVRVGDAAGDVLGGPQQALPGLFRLDVREGTVVSPPPGEAERLRAARVELGGVDAATQRLLQELGYVGP